MWELHKAHLDALWLVDPGVWPLGRIAFGLCRDLGLVADPRTILGLALCRLPGLDGYLLVRLRLLRLAAKLRSIAGRQHGFRASLCIELRGADEPRGKRLFP